MSNIIALYSSFLITVATFMCLNVTHASLVDEGVNLTDFFERCKPLFKEEGFTITYLTKMNTL